MVRIKEGTEGELVLKHILKVFSIGKFPLIKVIGHPGTGKSGMCIRLGELLNKLLHKKEEMPVEYIVDNIEDLLKIVIETKMEDKRVIVIEEMSTLFNNRRFMQQENITANSLFDTMRKKGMIVIGNYPITKTVDSHIEKSFNCEIETLRLDKTNHEYFVKCKVLQTNPGTGKTYSHLFSDDEGHDILYFRFNWCNKKTFEAYDENKDKFMKNIYELMLLKQQKKKMELEKLKAQVNGNYDNKRKPLTENQRIVLQELANGKTQNAIMREYGFGTPSAITDIKNCAFRKGYTIEEFKDYSKMPPEN